MRGREAASVMRVLLLSPFFHPEAISTGRYNTVLAQELVRSGTDVEVIASHPLYPDWRPKRSSACLPGMRIHRGGAWMRYPSNQALRRLLLELWYLTHVGCHLLRRRSRADRIVIVFPPTMLAMVLRWLVPRGTPLVGIVHDLQGVMAREGSSRAIARWLEQRALRTCDRLVFLSHSMRARAITDYALDASRAVVRYPFLTMPSGTDQHDALAGVLPEGHLHVVYSGALGDKQEPDKLLGLMQALETRDPRLRCHIFSAGPHFERLRTAANASAGRVEFWPLVPSSQLAELYSRCAIQIIPQASGTGDGAIPSKLPNLLAAGVPVFLVSDAHSEAALLIEQAGEGAGCRVGRYDGEDVLSQFGDFLGRVAIQSRQDRVARYRRFVEESFGVAAVVADVLRA